MFFLDIGINLCKKIYSFSKISYLKVTKKCIILIILILKKYLPIIFYVEYPEIESGSKEFAQKLLQAFQLRHPSCLETARSLLVSIEVGINIT